MKVLCVGDPHFKPGNRLETTQLFTETLRVIREIKPQAVIVLGDILDTFEKSDLDCFDEAVEYLDMIRKETFLIVLIGNHDRKNNQVYLNNRHYFTPLRYWPNTLVAWKVEEFSLTEDEITYKFLAVPYVPTGRLAEALRDFSLLDYQIVFAHQEFKNARMGAIISEHGDEWSLDNPLCISGHIHQYDQLQPNLIYPGTPFQHGFSDSADKGLFLIEILPGDMTFKRIPLGIWSKKNITLTIDELSSFSPAENIIYNINLIGDIKVIRKTLETETLKKITSSSQIHIRFKNVVQEVENLNKSEGVTSYYECLNHLIALESKNIQKIYHQLFAE